MDPKKINDMIQIFQMANKERNKHFDPQGQLDMLFFAVELAGEVGEACNIVKKLERERLGIRGSRSTYDALKEELEDVIICALLLANSAGIQLEPTKKFDDTSEKLDLPTMDDIVGD